MPNINIDDAYILNETGAQVDKTTGIPFKNESLTEAEAAQARANIRAGGSNPNLLDNAYFVGGGSQLGDGIFPINQRGQSSYSGNASTNVDRWWQQYDTTVTLISAGLRLTGKWNISQRLPRVLPNGTYTFSVDIVTLNSAGVTISFIDQSDQIVAGATKVIDSTGITSLTITSDQIKGVKINLTNSSGTGDITIASAKLELGTVSTLANDAPPNFFDEKKKCQAYLWHKTFGGNTQIGCGPAIDASTAIIDVVMPASMRTTPIITFTANVLLVGNGGVVIAASVIGINEYDNHLRLVVSATGLTAYQVYSFLTTTTTTMTVSAEP